MRPVRPSMTTAQLRLTEFGRGPTGLLHWIRPVNVTSSVWVFQIQKETARGTLRWPRSISISEPKKRKNIHKRRTWHILFSTISSGRFNMFKKMWDPNLIALVRSQNYQLTVSYQLIVHYELTVTILHRKLSFERHLCSSTSLI